MIEMAYSDYKFSADDTFTGIAGFYGITVSELMRINNLPFPPMSERPSTESSVSGDSLRVPSIINGTSTLEVEDTDEFVFTTRQLSRNAYIGYGDGGISGEIGLASQSKCWLVVENVGTVYFPCYPDSYSDSHNVSFSQQTVLGRSEPFQIYQNTGPRSVSVSFKMHREMTHTNSIGEIVGVVQAACYPTNNDRTIAPRCTLVIGDNCKITGVIGNVSTNWSDTILNRVSGGGFAATSGIYSTVDLSFSITECTGSPKIAAQVAALQGR